MKDIEQNFSPTEVPGDAQVQCDYRLPWNMQESALAPFLVAARPWLQAAENRIWRTLKEAKKKTPRLN